MNYKKYMLAILIIGSTLSCNNRTEEVKTENTSARTENTSDQLEKKSSQQEEISGKPEETAGKTENLSDKKKSTTNNSSKKTDPGGFHKSLSLQNFTFDVSSTTGQGSIQQLEIQTHGLKIDDKKITQEITGRVTNAEIADLNSDGFPEILIYITSAGSGSYGNVIGYSVNNGKSLSQVYFPPISDNPKANKGYMGHDEFTIVNKTLTQRFKTYNVDDVNSDPTGNIRQIQYKLINGESSRKFVVDKIIDYPIK